MRRGDRRRRGGRDPGPDRFPRSHHLRRLHAAPADRRIPRKLRSRRNDDVDHRIRSARARAAERPGRREGAGRRRDEMLRELPARRHAGLCGIGDPGAGSRRSSDFEELAQQGCVAREGRIWRVRHAVRLCADGPVGQAARHDHHGSHRRLVYSRLLGHLGGSPHCHAAARFVPRQRRPDRHARSRFSAARGRNQDCAPGLHRRQLAHVSVDRANC